MKKQLLLLSILSVILFSCDNEDDNPRTFFEGVYESVDENDAGFPITVMIFSKSGKLLVENYYSFVVDGELCLMSYSEGTYQLVGNEFKYILTSAFAADPASFNLGCSPKDQLISYFDPENNEQNGTLILDETADSFSLAYECNDMAGTICIGGITYLKKE